MVVRRTSSTSDSRTHNMLLLPSGMINKPRPARTYATWDPAAKGVDVTLSGGNLIATFGATFNTIVLATATIANTKTYWEMRYNAFSSPTGTNGGFGFSSAGVTNRSLGDLAADYAYRPNGRITSNNANILTVPTLIVGDIVGVHLDLVDNSVSWFKNGTLAGTHAVTAGTYRPAAGGSSIGGDAVQVNFNATRNFAYSSPNGFASGLWT
jgi:hypothetical protein